MERSRIHKLFSLSLGALLVAVCLLIAMGKVALAQLSVSPKQLDFKMVQGGPIPPSQQLSVTSAGGTVQWTAKVSGEELKIGASSGSTPGSLAVSWTAWWAAARQPGEYPGSITFTPQGAVTPAVSVTTTLTVVPKSPGPVFTYLSGPTGCTKPDGYQDDALCTVPNEKPPGDFTPPPPGQSYVDPNFGATVKLLSDVENFHAYSTPSPVSAKNRYVLIGNNDGLNVVYAASSKIAYRGVPGNLNTGIFWDADDDDVYYFYAGASVRKRDLKTSKTTIVADYSSPPYGFTSITSGGTGDGSKDNWISFFAPDQKQTCALDLNSVKTYCASYANFGPAPISFVDFTLITRGVDSGSGKRYVLLMANPALAAFSVNLAAGRLDPEFRGPEDPEGNGNHNAICEPGERCLGAPHSDVFADESGIQYLVSTWDTQSPCERALVTYRINSGTGMLTPVELGGGKKTVMTMFECGATWTVDHIGCAKSAPYCAVSTNHEERDPNATTPITRSPHLSEIMVMKGNGAEIRRLVEHRSMPFKNEDAQGYWSLSRAAISNDGGFVVADSNFGMPNQRRVILVKTGYGKPQLSSSGVVNSASFLPQIAPGSYVTLFGSSLTSADCQAKAETFPLPQNLCGTTVSYNGQPALLHYADSWQINTILPQGRAPGAVLRVVVSRQPDQDTSPPFDVPASSVLESAPAIFAYALEDGIVRAVVSNSDYSLNGPARPDIGSRPLSPGEWGIVWANGLGPTNPQVPDGEPAPDKPLAWAVHEVEVYVNGVRQTVEYAGLTPTLSTLYQVDFVLDPSTPVNGGDQDSIWLRVNGVESTHLPISLSPSG